MIDHVMVLLDHETFTEVESSSFLSETFARVKVKKADSSIAGSYRTLGVAGSSTLVEFFDAGDAPLGGMRGGLVFSFEEPGSSGPARAALDASDAPPYHYQLVERAVDGAPDPMPWYHLISVQLGSGSTLIMFLNEVTPEYFASLGAWAGEDGALRRDAYLRATLGRDHQDRRMSDLTGVTLVVGSPERARNIAEALAPFGYRAGSGDRTVEVRGDGLDLRLEIRDGEPDRVVAVDMAVAPGPAPREIAFGSSRLTIGNGTARWTFEGAGHE